MPFHYRPEDDLPTDPFSRAITLLQDGWTMNAAAQEVGLSRVTIWRHLKQNPNLYESIRTIAGQQRRRGTKIGQKPLSPQLTPERSPDLIRRPKLTYDRKAYDRLRPFRQKRASRILAAWTPESDITSIAQATGLGYSMVYNYCRELGIPVAHRDQLQARKQAQMYRLYTKQRLTQRIIAERFDCSVSAVSHAIKRHVTRLAQQARQGA